MRVEFQTTENVLGFSTGLPPVTIDISRLQDQKRHALERLVEEARFFELPARVPAPLGPDRQTCRITIEHEGRTHTVDVSCSVQGPALQKLIDRLIELEPAARRIRRAG